MLTRLRRLLRLPRAVDRIERRLRLLELGAVHAQPSNEELGRRLDELDARVGELDVRDLAGVA
jgi:hypothetical protein